MSFVLLNFFFKKEFEGTHGFWQIVAQEKDEWQKLENDFLAFSG